jgi:hypothetical protein
MPSPHLRRARASIAPLGVVCTIAAAAVVSPGMAIPQDAAAATLYVATDGSDDDACTRAEPCRSFDRAYDRAAPGDRVEVAGGTYRGSEDITGDKSSIVPVVIAAAAGASVTVTGGVDVVADYVTVRRMRANGFGVASRNPTNPIRGVRLEKVKGRIVFVQNTRNLVVTASEFGPNRDKETAIVGAWPASYDVTFANNYFHDTRPTSNTVHVECIEANNVQGLNVLNNRFERCGYFGILPGRLFASPNPRALRLEGNHFGKTYNCALSSCTSKAHWGIAPYSIMFGLDRWEGASVIKNNFFETAPGGIERVTFTRLIAHSNTGAAPAAWKRRLTRITASVSKTTSSLRVRAVLNPPQAGKRVVVTLYHKRAGGLRPVAVRRPLSSSGTYAAWFSRPRSGRCKARAHFRGDANSIPSSQTVTFAC